MIRHIVMWRLADNAEGRSKAENLLLMQKALLALRDRIPTIRRLEVGIDGNPTADSSHIVLVIDFDDWEGLRTYSAHPEHQRVVHELIRKVRTEKRVVDYEIARTTDEQRPA
jgi:hypothetical protein